MKSVAMLIASYYRDEKIFWQTKGLESSLHGEDWPSVTQALNCLLGDIPKREEPRMLNADSWVKEKLAVIACVQEKELLHFVYESEE